MITSAELACRIACSAADLMTVTKVFQLSIAQAEVSKLAGTASIDANSKHNRSQYITFGECEG